MLTVKPAVLAHHLRLNPQPEIQPGRLYPRDNLSKRTAQFALVSSPITQCPLIIVAVHEPAVIKNKHIRSERFCLPRKFEDFTAVKAEVECLPAVEDNRTRNVPVFPPANILPDTFVEVVRQCFESPAVERHNHFWSCHLFAGTEGVRELVGRESHLHTSLAVLVELGFRAESPAVYEHHCPAPPVCLCRLMVSKNHEGVVLVR